MSSDFARTFAPEIALLACAGAITTKESGQYGRRWRLTAAGLTALERSE